MTRLSPATLATFRTMARNPDRTGPERAALAEALDNESGTPEARERQIIRRLQSGGRLRTTTKPERFYWDGDPLNDRAHTGVCRRLRKRGEIVEVPGSSPVEWVVG